MYNKLRKIRLLVISPYEGMNEILKELLPEYPNIEASLYNADMDDAITLLQNIPYKNYDVILSRGGTATLLKQHTSIPVIDSGISALDVLRAIRLAQNFSTEFAVVGYDNITNHAYLLGEMLNSSFPIYTIKNSADIEEKLSQLKENGTHIIVCDVITSHICNHMGFNSVLITSGYESIRGALEQAIDFAHRYNIYKEENLFLSQAFLLSPLKCIIFSENGDIIQTTLQKTSQDEELLTYIKNRFSYLWDLDIEYKELHIKNVLLKIWLFKKYIFNNPYLYLYIEQAVTALEEKSGVISSRTCDDVPDSDIGTYNNYFFLDDIQDFLEKYSKSNSPVIIAGESGTGREHAAYYIYSHGNSTNQACYTIDCGATTSKDWNYLQNNSHSPLLYTGCTIFFRNFDQTAQPMFHKILKYIQESGLARRNRLIFSFTLIPGDETSKQNFHYLSKRLSCLSLQLLPLRERTEEIPRLATIYINQLNVLMGKQIIGFEQKAMSALQGFPWSDNLDQLQRIIKELMLLTTQSYISYENTMRVLHRETSIWTPTTETIYQLDLSQSLSAITYDIARLVLEQENGNHTKAAERLGVARSTLWRILKSHQI
ncbi:MAG: PrpR N-terminal domain-containing protein [Lachnospiraceae bacterium]